MVFINYVVISLGIKRMHVLYFLVTFENPKLTFIDIVLLQYVQAVTYLLFTIMSKYLRLYSVNS
jgi:hypothetical protein